MKEIPTIPSPRFLIGDIVWYAIPENSDPGIVTDCIYSAWYKKWSYNVSFDPGSEVNCIEEELSETKTLV